MDALQGKKLGAVIGLAVLTLALIAALVYTVRLVPQVTAELSTTPTPTPMIGNVLLVTPDPNATATPSVLKNGSAGEEVTRLQQRLKDLGYYDGLVDGQFGNGTRTAVTLFQQQNGLAADGLAGSATLTLLYSDAAVPCVTASPTPRATATPRVTEAPATEAPAVQTARVKGYVRDDGLPLVVSRKEPLPEGYETYDLVCMNDYCDASLVKIKYSDTYAEREAVDALIVMLTAAHEDGLTVWQISAAYRTEEYQKQLFDKQAAAYMKQDDMSRSRAETATRRTVADPGTSEHHLGTSFDITVPNKTFSGTKQCAWLQEHAWEYGFIQRYTKDKVSITGYSAEVWHYRWVGLEHAKIMHDEGLCLEEYIEQYGLIIDE